MSKEENFTPIPNCLKKEIPYHLHIFYSFAIRAQTIRRQKVFEKRIEEEDNSETLALVEVNDIAKRLHMDYKTAKKYCEELTQYGLFYHNDKDPQYENTYEALAVDPRGWFDKEINRWSLENFTAPSIKFLINEYIKGNQTICFQCSEVRGGFTKLPDEILYNKELSYKEKTWWYMFSVVAEYKTKALLSIKTTFALPYKNDNDAKKAIREQIMKLVKKGYVKKYITSKAGIELEMSIEKIDEKSQTIQTMSKK